MNNLLPLLIPLATGMIVGAIFGLLKLPVPAPAVLEGILGVVGLWAGWSLVSHPATVAIFRRIVEWLL